MSGLVPAQRGEGRSRPLRRRHGRGGTDAAYGAPSRSLSKRRRRRGRSTVQGLERTRRSRPTSIPRSRRDTRSRGGSMGSFVEGVGWRWRMRWRSRSWIVQVRAEGRGGGGCGREKNMATRGAMGHVVVHLLRHENPPLALRSLCPHPAHPPSSARLHPQISCLEIALTTMVSMRRPKHRPECICSSTFAYNLIICIVSKTRLSIHINAARSSGPRRSRRPPPAAQS